MVPILTYTNWNARPSDSLEQVSPFKRYFFICEGANTETWYFQSLIDLSKELRIRSNVQLLLLKKTEEDAHISEPERLIRFAEEQKKHIGFSKDEDRMVIVFDADVFESKLTGYESMVLSAEKENILGVTNPGFELFLLLHQPDSYAAHIKPNEEKIIANDWDGSQRYISKLFSTVVGMNSKRNPRIGALAAQVHIAIAQERHLNQDIHHCKGKLTSNIGAIIHKLIEEDAANVIRK